MSGVSTKSDLRLNFACGGSRWPGFVNSDINGEPGVAYVDLQEFPYPYDDGSADLILLSHALFMTRKGRPCHPFLEPIMAEFFRILEPGGWLRIDDNPWRCYDGGDLDPHEVALEIPRGYPKELRLPRGILCRILTGVGFSRVVDVPEGETLIPAAGEILAAVLGNRLHHYSFTVEAQK